MIELMALGLIAGSLFAGLVVLLFVVKMALRLILLPLLLLKFFILGILWLVIGPILFIAGLIAFFAVGVAIFIPLLPWLIAAALVWLLVRRGQRPTVTV